MTTLLGEATPWLLAFLAQSFVVIAAALVAGVAASHRGPAVRVATYRAAVFGTLALLFVGPVLRMLAAPHWSVAAPSPVSPAVYGPVDFAPSAAPVAVPVPPRPVVSDTGHFTLAPRTLPSATRTNFAGGALLLWLLGAAALGGVFGGGLFWLGRLKRTATAPSPQLDEAFRQLLGNRRPSVTLAVCPSVQGVFVTGSARPTIYVPTNFEAAFTPEQIEEILTHELIHVRRRDPQWAAAARLACVVAWPNPLVWLLARHLTQSAEELCDQLVLERGAAPATYGACLLRVAETLNCSRSEGLAAVGILSTKSHLSRRILLVLDKPLSFVTTLPTKARVLVASLATVCVVGVCLLVSTEKALGAGRHDSTPDATVLKMVEALSHNDYAGVFSRIMDAKVDQVVPEMSKGLDFRNLPEQIVAKVGKVDISGDSATVDVEISYPSQSYGPKMVMMPTKEKVHLHRIGDNWLIVDGEGERSMFTQLAMVGRDPSLAQKARSAAYKTVILSNLKQIALAVFMYSNDHNDTFAFDQASLKSRLAPYLKGANLWMTPDGKPLDVRINPTLKGVSQSSISQPSVTVMLSVGPRGSLKFFDGITPVAFCDGHVKMFRQEAAEKLNWAPRYP